MSGRNDNYSGSINKVANGRYRAQIQIKGKRKSKNFPDRKSAREWLDKMRKSSSRVVANRGIELTFEDYVTITWLPMLEENQSESYYNDCKRRLERDLLPVFGKQALIDITSYDIQDYFNQQLEDKRGTRAIELDYSILRKIFNDAIKAKYVDFNPVHGVIKPKHKKAEFTPLTPDQARTFILYMEQNKHPLRYLFIFLLHTGLRIGECLGLTWDSIDFIEGKIKIERQLQPVSGGGYRLGPLKTKRSKREILMSSTVYNLLLEQKELQEQRKKYVQDNPLLEWHNPPVTLDGTPDGPKPEFVFTSEVGSPLNSCNLIKRMHKILDECGLPRIRIHDLRHTAATIWLSQGIPLFIVSRLLGHESVSTTADIYGHLYVENQAEAVETMEAVLELIEIDFEAVFETAPKMPPTDPHVFT